MAEPASGMADPLPLEPAGARRLWRRGDAHRCGERARLVGANMAFRREVFDEFGTYDPAHQAAAGAVTAVEDHEIELRLFRAGRTGLYDPRIVMHAAIQASRLEKRYHRRWHSGHGRAVARLLLPSEDFNVSGIPVPAETDALRLVGVPGWLYRATLVHALGAVLRRDEDARTPA